MPGVVVLRNGTRLVVHEIIINSRAAPANETAVLKVEEPLNITLRYRRQYLVRLEAPANSTEVWAALFFIPRRHRGGDVSRRLLRWAAVV